MKSERVRVKPVKAIRLVSGHFDGETERASGEPQERLHKRLPYGEWVDSVTGLPVTHDVYHLGMDGNSQRVYTCTERAIEKSTWLKLQVLKGAR
jgi:hypothetical protein